jgi:flagellar biosynthesis/type III secretory pathway protein FliH
MATSPIFTKPKIKHMKHKLIKTDNYLLVVDDKIEEGDFLLSKEGIIHANFEWNFGDKRIIAHLPLNNSPILEGVDLLPPLEDDVEKLANKWAIDNSDITMESNSALNKGFKGGYNKAKEKYKYTEEDMRKAIDMAQEESWDEGGYLGLEHEPNKIIQSLQQPKYPVAFECEMERNLVSDKPKTITNSQGQTQLVGTYIYE